MPPGTMDAYTDFIARKAVDLAPAGLADVPALSPGSLLDRAGAA